MSATELIKQVAALPPPERALFEQLFHAMEQRGAGAGGLPGQPQWPDFGQRLRDIYGDKTAPDSQTIIDAGREHR